MDEKLKNFWSKNKLFIYLIMVIIIVIGGVSIGNFQLQNGNNNTNNSNNTINNYEKKNVN